MLSCLMVGAPAPEEVHGFDLRSADVIGTSAGSVLTACSELTAAQLRPPAGNPISHGPLAASPGTTSGDRRRPPQLPKLIPTSRRSLASSARRLRQLPPPAVLASFLPQGRGSLERIQHLVEAITPMDEWSPHPNAWVVAMDLDEGRRVAFGRPEAPTVPLATAVMASCAIPSWFAPVQINGHSYVDGGACSATNVDLVADMGLDEVYVLAPMVSFAMNKPDSVLARMEHRWRVQITKRCLHETEKVREQGAAVIALGPGPEDLDAMGPNLMDVKRRLPVLETSMRTSVEALRDPDRVGPDHLADVG
jgi:NTE family protein